MRDKVEDNHRHRFELKRGQRIQISGEVTYGDADYRVSSEGTIEVVGKNTSLVLIDYIDGDWNAVVPVKNKIIYELTVKSVPETQQDEESKQFENRLRDVDKWYTLNNIYCFYRLWLMQRDEKVVVNHSQLDNLHIKFLNEIGVNPMGKVLMSEKFAKNGKDILYNTAEQAKLLLILHDAEDDGHVFERKDIMDLARFAKEELAGFAFDKEEYRDFNEIIEYVKDEFKQYSELYEEDEEDESIPMDD